MVPWIVALAAVRILIWDADPAAPAWLLWHLALAGTLGIAGLLARERWPAPGLAGWLLAGAWLVAGIAAARAADPVTAIGLWAGWGGILGLAWLLRAWPAAAAPAVAAAVAGAGLLALGQGVFTLPALAEAVRSGDPRVAGVPQDLLAQRIAGGGWYGPFVIANTLAVALGCGLAVAAGWAWRGAGPVRALGIPLVLIAAAGLLGAGAKGGILVLLLGLAWAWWRHVPARRWLAPAALGAGALLLVLPEVRAALAPSVQVRLGYWAGGWDLVRAAPWTGLGLDGFSQAYPSVMRPGDEPTRYAHNELVEAAVAGGIPLALLLLAGMAALLARPAAAEPGTGARRPIAVAVAALVLGAAALGLLDGDGGVAWWPGGQGPGFWPWAAAVAAAMGGAAALATHAVIPPWARSAGLALLLLGCLIDFHLRSPGLWVLAAALAAGPVMPSARRWWPMLTAGLAAMVALGAFSAAQRSLDRTLALDALAAEGDRAAAARAALTQAPGDAQVALAAVALLPLDEALPLSEVLTRRLPGSARAAGLAAETRLAAGDREGAITMAREAVRRAPTHLVNRDRLIQILERCDRGAEAAAERAERERLEPLVHGADRRE
ncbi:MAG: hypothetical protein RLZZ127_1371 [Planctomycetota bacterium]|jgi:hypothetical protein